MGIDYEQKKNSWHALFNELQATLWLFPCFFLRGISPCMMVDAILKVMILRYDHFATGLSLSYATKMQIAKDYDSSASVEKPA